MATATRSHPPPTLKDLLQQSRRLTNNLDQSNIPSLNLGLDQIESQSRRLVSKHQGNQDGAADAKAAYLLAGAGVNADELSRHVNQVDLVSTFEPLQPIHDTDLEGYLRHEHEQAIITAIEEGRRQTSQDFYRNLNASMRLTWESQRDKIFDELGRHNGGAFDLDPSSSLLGGGGGSGGGGDMMAVDGGGHFGTTSSLTSSRRPPDAQTRQYSSIISTLNQHLKQNQAFSIMSAFKTATTQIQAGGGPGDFKSIMLPQLWQLLAFQTGEIGDPSSYSSSTTMGVERKFARDYLGDEDGMGKQRLRGMIAEGSRRHLEEQFMQHVDREISSHPAEANLGGVPSIQNKIRAYLNLRFSKQQSTQGLEIVNGLAIWPRIFYLLRSGHLKEALNFCIQEESNIERADRNFIGFFKAWVESSEHRLSRPVRDRFLAEYNQRLRYSTSIDPYKQALYKLIGRTELNRRNLPILTTTEDWLWFQLYLVRDFGSGGGGNSGGGTNTDASHEKYGIRDLAKLVEGFGASYFDPKGDKPIAYAMVLLLCGQYEKAVGFLYQSLQVEAVHLAVALSYYGLLRPAPPRQALEGDILSTELDSQDVYEIASINYPRILHRFLKSWALEPEIAIQYLCTICLHADAPGKLGKEQVEICHRLVREFVTERRAYGLLGQIRSDGSKVPGQLELDAKLLHLSSQQQYLSDIVNVAAARADQEKRLDDALLLYQLAEDYDSVIRVLNAQLGSSLGLSNKPSDHNLVEKARTIMNRYERSSIAVFRMAAGRKETCHMLLRLVEFMALRRDGNWGQALAVIQDVDLVPLTGDLVVIIRKAEDFKRLDEAITRNLSVILLATMEVLRKLHESVLNAAYNETNKQTRLAEIRTKAKTLILFASNLQYRLDRDTHAQLSTLSVPFL